MIRNVQSCSKYSRMKVMSHAMKKRGDDQSAAVWFQNEKVHYRRDVCFDSVDGEV